MKNVIIASHNEGKVEEFRTLFKTFGTTVVSLKDLDYYEEITETGVTFQENAIMKAQTIANHFQRLVVADDSGLVIDALNGRPGVFSARFAGMERDDKANIRKVLAEMDGVREVDRTARFVCVLAMAGPGEFMHTFKGTCEGTILTEPKGSSGFGYDPIFYIPSLGKTLAQMDRVEKNKISHRALALNELRTRWKDIV